MDEIDYFVPCFHSFKKIDEVFYNTILVELHHQYPFPGLLIFIYLFGAFLVHYIPGVCSPLRKRH
jgi:hypothetical protein